MESFEIEEKGAPEQRLVTLATITRVINSIMDIDQVLQVIMDCVIDLARAERGFIMLVEPSTADLTFRTARNFEKENLYSPRFEISRNVVFQVFRTGTGILCMNAMEDPRFAFAPSVQEFGLRSILCVPLMVRGRVIGVIYLDNRLRLGTFSQDDFDFLTTFSDQAALALDRANLETERAKIRSLFERYVSSQVVEEILARGTEIGLEGERRKITVMFCDVRGFTSLAERLDPIALVAQLNEFYQDMGEIIFESGGTLFSYMGDAIMAVFGAPLSHGDDEVRAVSTALKMHERLAYLKERWVMEGRPSFEIGIGINAGEAVVGDVGCLKKREYTVLGDTVNTAARLEKLNKEFATRIIISDSVRERLGEGFAIQALGEVAVRGKAAPLLLYTVIGQAGEER